MRESLGASAGVAALAFAAFSAAMTIGRLGGDRLTAAWGAEALIAARRRCSPRRASRPRC